MRNIIGEVDLLKFVTKIFVRPIIIPIKYNSLLIEMISRDVKSRYKNSVIGMFWVVLLPILMLSIYAFVFSVVFKIRWSGSLNSSVDFPIILFSGLIIYMIFSESVSRSSLIILEVSQYIKNLSFPSEIIAYYVVGSVLFNFIFYVLILLVGYISIYSFPPLNLIFSIFLVIAPLSLFCMGLVWLLSILGLFFRDTQHLINIAVTAFLFLSPVFYPVDSVPEKFRIVINFSPLTFPIETFRGLLFFGKFPEWGAISVYWIISIAVFYLGYHFFCLMKESIADVL